MFVRSDSDGKNEDKYFKGAHGTGRLVIHPLFLLYTETITSLRSLLQPQ
jgi:hypothetical protein